MHGTPLLVTAGPGSGKTRVVSERVKDLILNQNVAPEKILCITFTVAGQKEMEKRLENDPDFKRNAIHFPIGKLYKLHQPWLPMIASFFPSSHQQQFFNLTEFHFLGIVQKSPQHPIGIQFTYIFSPFPFIYQFLCLFLSDPCLLYFCSIESVDECDSQYFFTCS